MRVAVGESQIAFGDGSGERGAAFLGRAHRLAQRLEFGRRAIGNRRRLQCIDLRARDIQLAFLCEHLDVFAFDRRFERRHLGFPVGDLAEQRRNALIAVAHVRFQRSDRAFGVAQVSLQLGFAGFRLNAPQHPARQEAGRTKDQYRDDLDERERHRLSPQRELRAVPGRRDESVGIG